MKYSKRGAAMRRLQGIGPKPNVIQIVPPRTAFEVPAAPKPDAPGAHELVSGPLSAPTAPGGAAGFRNRAGSTIQRPQVMNVYLGPFWSDCGYLESFSKAVVENGYLDPLRELGYGTGSGVYLGATNGPDFAGATFSDADARAVLARMLDAGAIHGDENSLFMLILPDSAVPTLGDYHWPDDYCGYHDALPHNATDVAYAVLPRAYVEGLPSPIGEFTAAYAHALAEACTDKIPGKGWVADDGSENGDLEAWTLFGWGPPSNPKLYTVQGYYTNERGNTIGAWRDTASLTAAAATVATSAQDLVDLVSGCALGETDFSKKVSAVVSDPSLFRQCVFAKMKNAGFDLDIRDIPAGGSTTLEDVLKALAQM